MRVIIGGNWGTYQGKILQYMRQLAVITPCARTPCHRLARTPVPRWLQQKRRRLRSTNPAVQQLSCARFARIASPSVLGSALIVAIAGAAR
jgi:hypothetical protein